MGFSSVIFRAGKIKVHAITVFFIASLFVFMLPGSSVLCAQLAVTKFSALPNNGLVTEGYTGSTISIEGSGLLGTTSLKIGGSSGVSVSSFTVINDSSLTFVAPAGASGFIYLASPASNVTTTQYFKNLGYITARPGDFNAAATWLSSLKPAAGANITLNHAITLSSPADSIHELRIEPAGLLNLSSSSAAVSAGSISNDGIIRFSAAGRVSATSVINKGALLFSGNGRLTINRNGLLTNGDTAKFSSGTGTVVFAGNVSVTGFWGFYNVDLGGVANFEKNNNISGKLQVFRNGSVTSNPFNYLPGSVLSIVTGSPMVIDASSLLWTSGISGVGVPDKIDLSNAATSVRIVADKQVRSSITISNGALINNSNSLTVGPEGGGNSTFLLNGGIFTNNGGTLTVNGNIELKSGSFSFSSGDIIIDPNSGAAESSVASDKDILAITSGLQGYATGGTITFVDPPFAGKGRSFAFIGNGIDAAIPATTLVFGGNSRTHSSTAVNGFNIDTKVNSRVMLLGNIVVNGGPEPNRYVSGPEVPGHGFDVGGNLTIKEGSEIRTLATPLKIDKSIINDGVFTDLAGISFQYLTAPASVLQKVSGSGIFRNSVAAPTANFTSLLFNNSTTPIAVSFNIGTISVSRSVSFVEGAVDIGANNDFLFLGSASATRSKGFLLSYGREGRGQMKKEFDAPGIFTFFLADKRGVFEYSPVTFTLVGSSLARTIGVRVADQVHPQMNRNGVQGNYVSRYFIINNSGDGDYLYKLKMAYVDEDIVGAESRMRINMWNGSQWGDVDGSVSSNLLDVNETTSDRLPLGSVAEFTARDVTTLPIVFTGIHAMYQQELVNVGWKSLLEEGLSYYVVERSTDGIHFQVASGIIASQETGIYNWTDSALTAGNRYYYRVKAVEFSGQITYSGIVRIDISNIAENVRLYPNPVIWGKIYLHLANIPHGTYSISIIGSLGQLLYKRQIVHQSAIETVALSIPSLPSNIYDIIISNGTFYKKTIRFIAIE